MTADTTDTGFAAEQIVAALFRAILNRPPDAGGLAHDMGALRRGRDIEAAPRRTGGG